MTCQPDSKEIVQICWKHIRGLNKVKLIDVSFIQRKKEEKDKKTHKGPGTWSGTVSWVIFGPANQVLPPA